METGDPCAKVELVSGRPDVDLQSRVDLQWSKQRRSRGTEWRQQRHGRRTGWVDEAGEGGWVAPSEVQET